MYPQFYLVIILEDSVRNWWRLCHGNNQTNWRSCCLGVVKIAAAFFWLPIDKLTQLDILKSKTKLEQLEDRGDVTVDNTPCCGHVTNILWHTLNQNILLLSVLQKLRPKSNFVRYQNILLHRRESTDRNKTHRTWLADLTSIAFDRSLPPSSLYGFVWVFILMLFPDGSVSLKVDNLPQIFNNNRMVNE